MLSCRETLDKLEGYLARTLTWREWLGVALHLLLCFPCRRYLQSYRQTIEVVRQCDETSATPPALHDELVRKILDSRERD